MIYMDMYFTLVNNIFNQVCKILKIQNFKLRIINRRTQKVRRLGYINLKTQTIGIDILTPKRREPKSINSIIRVLAHELAHYQKKPYRQFFRGAWINRIHYPQFYRQVNKNISKIKKDKVLGKYFTK